MVGSDNGKAIAGEEVTNFSAFFFPAVTTERTIGFMGERIQTYEKTTRKIAVNKDNISKRTDFVVP